MKKQTFPKHPLYSGLTIRNYTEYSNKITHPLRAALITDLHSTKYGDRQELLLAAIHRQRPDLILMAGDIADHKAPMDGTLLLLDGLKARYPSFYVSGNHEHWTGEMESIRGLFADRGVTVLAGDTKCITLGGQSLLIGGVDDPHAFTTSHHSVKLDAQWDEQFLRCCARTSHERYCLLLSHRPELTRYYKNCGFDLIVSGHAHGGQIRIPGVVNGLLAPHQGFFPRYAGGQYKLGRTSLIVSRGLCLNRLPRVFNPPELVIIDILSAPAESPA